MRLGTAQDTQPRIREQNLIKSRFGFKCALSSRTKVTMAYQGTQHQRDTSSYEGHISKHTANSLPTEYL